MKKDVFDELIVVKRSGQRVSFNGYKIAVAIKHAFDSIETNYNEKNINEVYEEVLKYIEENYVGRKTINVEDIQDIIEDKLKEKKYVKVFKSFHEYRNKRAASRKIFTEKKQHKFTKAMEQIANENILNTDNNFKSQEIINDYGMTIVKEFTKSYVIDTKSLRAHEEGYIFINDLNNFTLGLMQNIHFKLDKHLNDDLTKTLINLRKEISKIISIPSIDYLYQNKLIKIYKLSFKEHLNKYLNVSGFKEYINLNKINDLIDHEVSLNFNIKNYEQFIYSEVFKNIIILSNKDALLKAEEELKKELIKLFNTLDYIKNTNISFGTNTSYEGKIINKIIFEILNENEYKELDVIYKIKKDNNLQGIYNLINKKDIYLSFIDNSFNKDLNEIEYFTDGTRIFENYNSDFRESIGRSIVASTSININRIALENKDKGINEFYKKLDEMLDIVKNNLLLSFETIGNKTKDNYEVLFKGNVLEDDKLENNQKIRKVIKNGNLIIGIVGLNEAVSILKPNDEYKLTLEILKYLNKKCDEYMNETKVNFYINETSDIAPRKALTILDKAVYGASKEISKDPLYNLSQNLTKEDYKKYSEIQKLFTGGSFHEINIPSNISLKKFNNLINNLIESDIGFTKISIKRSDK